MYSTLIISEDKQLILSIEESFKKDGFFEITNSIPSYTTANHLIKVKKFQLIIIEFNQSYSETLKWLKNNSNQNFELIVFHNRLNFPNQLLNYRVNAFIDKSNISKEFGGALKQVRFKLETAQKENIRLSNLIKIASQNRNIKISLSLSGEIKLINSIDIISIKASGNATEIYLSNRQNLKVNKSINQFENLLCDLPFSRIHRSHIVNLMHIKQLVIFCPYLLCLLLYHLF
jgi:two-component system LytT family response regulator